MNCFIGLEITKLFSGTEGMAGAQQKNIIPCRKEKIKQRGVFFFPEN
jgi:hypothetical protein